MCPQRLCPAERASCPGADSSLTGLLLTHLTLLPGLRDLLFLPPEARKGRCPGPSWVAEGPCWSCCTARCSWIQPDLRAPPGSYLTWACSSWFRAQLPRPGIPGPRTTPGPPLEVIPSCDCISSVHCFSRVLFSSLVSRAVPSCPPVRFPIVVIINHTAADTLLPAVTGCPAPLVRALNMSSVSL